MVTILSVTELKYPYHGRLDELGFLERLYDLDNMPSNDSRYSNAHGDISCHLRFGDYEDEYWIFQDERFSLRQGDGDEAFITFFVHDAASGSSDRKFAVERLSSEV